MSRETSQFEETVEAWAHARLEALAAEAAELAPALGQPDREPGADLHDLSAAR